MAHGALGAAGQGVARVGAADVRPERAAQALGIGPVAVAILG